MLNLRVFISSVIQGLERHREILKSKISNIPIEPYPEVILFEDELLGLSSSHLSQWTPQFACLNSVNKCHIIIGLLSKEYGQVQESGFSSTHEELRHALDKGKRVLIFVDEGSWFGSGIEVLKEKITALVDNIERKFYEEQTEESYTNFINATNERKMISCEG